MGVPGREAVQVQFHLYLQPATAQILKYSFLQSGAAERQHLFRINLCLGDVVRTGLIIQYGGVA